MTPLAPGDRIGGRYRLERELGHGKSSSTWQAFDERLGRPVAVRIFEGGTDRRTLTKRAGQAASLTHPRAVRVFDTGFEEGRFFTVCELLSGSVASAQLPLPPHEALRVATDVAEALAHAHEKGVIHGHLSEANVLLSSAGAKLGDFALAADSPADPGSDLAELGALVRRLVGAPVGPVPDEPVGFGPIVEGLAAGAYDSAAQLFDDLRSLGGDETAAATPGRRRWWIAFVAAVLIAAAVGGATQLGERSPRTRLVPGGRIEGTPLAVTGIEDFDPLGDGREGRATVGKVADGNPQTFWSTERYQAGPNFSGLKPGVGLVFDLGTSVEVGKAQLLFPAAGCSFEIRYTDDRAAPVEQWKVAASVQKSPPSAPIIFPAAPGRWWLLWITALTTDVPGAGRAYACAVAEADLFAP